MSCTFDECHLHRTGHVTTQPNSPDLNPVDYAICTAVQERLYNGRKSENVEQLKQVIVLEWHALSPRNFIDGSMYGSGCVACRLSVIQENGGHIY